MRFAVAITGHALSRYWEHHPESTRKEMHQALQKSVEIHHNMAASLVQRPLVAKGRKSRDRFFIAPDRRGMFVQVCEEEGDRIVTYLRFAPWQEEYSLKNWPIPEEDDEDEKPEAVQSPCQILDVHPGQVDVSESVLAVWESKRAARRMMESCKVVLSVFDDDSWGRMLVLSYMEEPPKYVVEVVHKNRPRLCKIGEAQDAGTALAIRCMLKRLAA